jgi:ribonuclease HI
MHDSWLIYSDGSALPNPGRMAVGALIIAPSGEETRLSQLLPGQGCNNEAELRALTLALQTALQLGATRILAHCDSRVVVDELLGRAPRPLARLAEAFAAARSVLAQFSHCELRWLPAHRNTMADALARSAFGLAARRTRPVRKRR